MGGQQRSERSDNKVSKTSERSDLDTLVLRVDEDAHMRLEGRRDGLPWTNALRGSVRGVKDLLELVAKGVSLPAAHEGSI